jgi:hypothetical protein
MNYFLISDEGTGNHFISHPGELTESYLPGFTLYPAADYDQSDLMYLRKDATTGQLIRLPNTEPVATLAYIQNKRAYFETRPIQVFSYLIDSDVTSAGRMNEALSAWAALPIIAGQLEILDEVRKIYWTLADNSKVTLNYAEFEDLYNEFIRQRAIRTSKLYAAYQIIKNNPNATNAYVDDVTNWLN